MSKILLALSGGVDSAMAALLLKKQGHQLMAVTLLTFDNKTINEKIIEESQNITEKLAIPHYIINCIDEFKNTVINYFLEGYLSGQTPNPCTYCNRILKWKLLLREVQKHQYDYIATGHYAVKKEENGRYFISKAKDKWKDQSYFLWNLSQEQIQKTIFPLSNFTKNEVKAEAAKNGFANLSEKKESYNVCFAPDNDFKKLISQKYSNSQLLTKGNVINKNGQIIGQHKGYPFYTLGQHKDIDYRSAEKLYVTKIIPEKNELQMGTRNDLACKKFSIINLNIQKKGHILSGETYVCWVRPRNSGIEATIDVNTKNNTAIVFLKKNENIGIAPGQSAVFYDENDDVVLGGVIAKKHLA